MDFRLKSTCNTSSKTIIQTGFIQTGFIRLLMHPRPHATYRLRIITLRWSKDRIPSLRWCDSHQSTASIWFLSSLPSVILNLTHSTWWTEVVTSQLSHVSSPWTDSRRQLGVFALNRNNKKSMCGRIIDFIYSILVEVNNKFRCCFFDVSVHGPAATSMIFTVYVRSVQTSEWFSSNVILYVVLRNAMFVNRGSGPSWHLISRIAQ